MKAVDTLSVSNLAIDKSVLDRLFNEAAWKWYEANKEMELFSIKVWFLSKTIRVKDVRPLLVKMFGEQRGAINA